MKNLSFTSVDDFRIFLKEEKSNKILIICGENSFKKSTFYQIDSPDFTSWDRRALFGVQSR